MELPRGTPKSGGSRQHAKGLNVEYHIVYRKGPVQPVERRGYQQVHVPRTAVFSTYEEARLYILMVALIDRHVFGHGKNGCYRAQALPFDLAPDQFERILVDHNGDGWKLEHYPMYSPFVEPIGFDGNGLMTLRYGHRLSNFESRTARNYSEQICAGETPQFAVGDLVFLQWDYTEDTYAVISALGCPAGPVQKLESTSTWTGWYYLRFMAERVWEEYVHVGYDFELRPASTPLPSSFRMLELLSRHYKGESVFSEEVLNRLLNEGVRVENMEYFPFGDFEVHESVTPAPVEGKAVRTAGPIVIPSMVEAGKIVTRQGKPALESVFVVLAMRIDCGLGKLPCDAFDLYAPPAAFTSLDEAISCAEFHCAVFLRQQYDLGTPDWTALHQCRIDRLPLEFDPGLKYEYDFRIQIVKLMMAPETITDEDLVHSLAFEDLVVHTWCYNLFGTLLWESPAPEVPVFERYAFEGHFSVGDLVYVVPQGLDPESESIEGDVAVVSEAPVSKAVWLAEGNEPESWNPFYTVDFVGPGDFLHHYNVPESSLLLARFPMRKDDLFLPLWSKHLRGELAFPDGLADRIRARKVLLRKCPRYDFATGEIVE